MNELVIKNLFKSYTTGGHRIKAIKDVSISFQAGESVAVIGPSGSGKSTLLNLIGLILKPDKGKVFINEKCPLKFKDSVQSDLRNRTFGYIVQDFALIDDETSYNNIRIPLLYNKSVRHKEYEIRIKSVAKLLGIEDKIKLKVSKLSGGERQRVAIARAIICNQPVILADEPTGSLDVANKENVINILINLCKQHNKILIIATHDLSIADRCDRVIKMMDGEIVNTHT
nr:ABC transporter ATP-binding protein [Tissierella sp.]